MTGERASARCDGGRKNRPADPPNGRVVSAIPPAGGYLAVGELVRRDLGPHHPDIPPAPRIDPERLDGLSTRAAGEGPRGVRPPVEQVETALERRELLRPHRPEHLGAPLCPPGDSLPRDVADRVRVLRRGGSAGARDGLGTGARPRIAPALSVSRNRPGVCGRAEGQRSVDAFVRVPRVRTGCPSGPVAVVSLARALGPDADALGSPRGTPHAHFHRPPSRVASRGPPGLVMAGELTHARLDHRRVWRLRPRLDAPLVLDLVGRASDCGPS